MDEYTYSSEVFLKFHKLLGAYQDYQQDALKEYDLSPNEIAVLANIGSISTASEIATNIDVSKALVSRSVKALKEKGYINISISAVDKREQKLVLTDKGQELTNLIFEANSDFFDVAFDEMHSQEKEVLELLLKMMIKNCEELKEKY